MIATVVTHTSQNFRTKYASLNIIVKILTHWAFTRYTYIYPTKISMHSYVFELKRKVHSSKELFFTTTRSCFELLKVCLCHPRISTRSKHFDFRHSALMEP